MLEWNSYSWKWPANPSHVAWCNLILAQSQHVRYQKEMSEWEKFAAAKLNWQECEAIRVR